VAAGEGERTRKGGREGGEGSQGVFLKSRKKVVGGTTEEEELKKGKGRRNQKDFLNGGMVCPREAKWHDVNTRKV